LALRLTERRHNDELGFSPDGKKVATTMGNTILIWDVESGKELQALAGAHTGERDAYIGFMPDGKRMFTRNRYVFRIWDIESAQELHKHELFKYEAGRYVLVGEILPCMTRIIVFGDDGARILPL
jgi:WD40 repeat protein